MTRCLTCGGTMTECVTDLPFKLTLKTIVVVRALPVLQCDACAEYLIGDEVMARVDEILAKVDRDSPLEIYDYAA